MTRLQVGPRMRQLCQILALNFDGRAPSQRQLYMELNYHGNASNAHGHAATVRAMAAGLMKAIPAKGNRYEVELTPLGWSVARGER